MPAVGTVADAKLRYTARALTGAVAVTVTRCHVFDTGIDEIVAPDTADTLIAPDESVFQISCGNGFAHAAGEVDGTRA